MGFAKIMELKISLAGSEAVDVEEHCPDWIR
jgi:hypothetical protein